MPLKSLLNLKRRWRSRVGLTSYHSFMLAPIKEWTINLVQHSHTDIGYTRSQTEILAEHLRFIDYALDYCDQTDHYPDDARFRWTCEASWTVREYLKARPKGADRPIAQTHQRGQD
jgi:alpha-mannosidase